MPTLRRQIPKYLSIVQGPYPVRSITSGAEPEELLGFKAPSLIIPGDDPSHATSGAHYLRELLPKAEFWSVMPPEQTTQKVCDRILEFARK